jgi:8-oxo-dGTP pyrophosphatase MutT (NUDIX family)
MKQIAALPLIASWNGEVEIFLVTTRGGGRWIVPKGNPVSGLAPHDVAAREAWEEAGLVGTAAESPVGSFSFSRRGYVHEQEFPVSVYPLWVERQSRHWPERGERTVLRCSVNMALSLISVPGLAELVSAHLAAVRKAVWPAA